MRYKLTDRSLRELPAPKSGNKLYYDQAEPGFALRVTSADVRSFVLNYRHLGRERRITIGAYPTWSVTAAREQARKLRRQVDDGKDPLDAREKARQAPTVKGLCERYMAEHARPKKRKASANGDQAMIDRFVIPKLGNRKVESIKFTDVDRLHREITASSGPYTANRVHSLLRKMYTLAVDRWQLASSNPCRGIERNQEVKRTRYLSTAELSRVAETLRTWPGDDEHAARRIQSCNAIRLLLLTGARKTEVLSATWDQFDLVRGVWIKPGATTKQKTEHRVPLSSAAIELLSDIRAGAGDSPYVFPGEKPGTHQQDVKGAWEAIRKLAGIEDVRVHDLRHSYAAQLASAGLGLPVIGALLGHTQAATTHRYAHLADDPLREATERVGAMFSSAATGKRAEVTPIDRANSRRSQL